MKYYRETESLEKRINKFKEIHQKHGNDTIAIIVQPLPDQKTNKKAQFTMKYSKS